MNNDYLYWNIFYQPMHRIGEKVDAVITTFDCCNEEEVRALFMQSYIGVCILSTSSHYSRENAYKQIYDLGDLIHSHDDFHSPNMICSDCGQNSINVHNDNGLCSFCHIEKGLTK